MSNMQALNRFSRAAVQNERTVIMQLTKIYECL